MKFRQTPFTKEELATGKFTRVILQPNQPAHQKIIINLLSSYKSNRAGDNYHIDKIQHAIDKGKFNIGFLIILFNGEPVAVTGMQNYKGWVVLTRYVHAPNVRGFFFLSYGIDVVKQICNKGNFKGWMALFNQYNEQLKSFVLDKRVLNRFPYLKLPQWKGVWERDSIKTYGHVLFNGIPQLCIYESEHHTPPLKILTDEEYSRIFKKHWS